MPRTAWSLEQLRNLAVSMVIDEAQTPGEVAAALDVSERSVWRWLALWRDAGEAGLAARAGRGRPPKLTDRQARRVLDWVGHASPCDFGFVTERWTAPRVALLIERRLGVHMNHRYLNDWLLRRGGITPQVPARRPRERDQRVIDAWVDRDWPRIKKRRRTSARPWFFRTKVGSCCCPWSAARSPRVATPRSCVTGRGTATRSRWPRR